MNSGRSRFALFGVLALAMCVAFALVAGTADAKKKKKKKGGNSVTLSQTTPTAIPAGDAVTGISGVATLPFTVGKKAKGKVVSSNSLTATFQVSDPAGSLDDLDLKVIAPNGRTVFLDNPALFAGSGSETVVGPLTQTANSSTGYCAPNPAPPPPGCPAGDPDNILPPPWAGTARNLDLAFFSGVQARGTWLLKVINFSTSSTHVLNMASIHMDLATVAK